MKEHKLKKFLYIVIFESNTRLGFLFDIVLIINILISTSIMMLDSIAILHVQYKEFFDVIEWGLTSLFIIEYLARLYCSPNRLKYAKSFFGIIDFCALFPSFLGLVLLNSQYLVVVRLLRILRIFRILRLVKFLDDSTQLLNVLKMSSRKVILFIFAELILTVLFGSIMYAIEGEANGFTSIPKSIYWAIVTMTTVGYGDIAPQTPLGQTFAAFAMILAYSIVVISVGMIPVDNKLRRRHIDTEKSKTSKNLYIVCPRCKCTLSEFSHSSSTPIMSQPKDGTDNDSADSLNSENYLKLNYIHYCPQCGFDINKLHNS